MGVNSRLVSSLHAASTLGAGDTCLMSLFVDGRAVRKVLSHANRLSIVIGEDIALAEKGNWSIADEVQITMPL